MADVDNHPKRRATVLELPLILRSVVAGGARGYIMFSELLEYEAVGEQAPKRLFIISSYFGCLLQM